MAICVSRRVHEDARGKLDIAFEDIGEQQLKNIAWPVRVYRVSELDAAKRRGRDRPWRFPTSRRSPSCRFSNMSGDPEQEYFADGITEDIITGLSRIPSLFVIARNSSFAYKGKAIDVRQVGRELGVRYVLEGSVRKAGQRLRITGQLVEAETGPSLGRQVRQRSGGRVRSAGSRDHGCRRRDRTFDDASRDQARQPQAHRKPAGLRLAAARARRATAVFARQSLIAPCRWRARAIELDPRYAQAYAYLASWTCRRMI